MTKSLLLYTGDESVSWDLWSKAETQFIKEKKKQKAVLE